MRAYLKIHLFLLASLMLNSANAQLLSSFTIDNQSFCSMMEVDVDLVDRNGNCSSTTLQVGYFTINGYTPYTYTAPSGRKVKKFVVRIGATLVADWICGQAGDYMPVGSCTLPLHTLCMDDWDGSTMIIIDC